MNLRCFNVGIDWKKSWHDAGLSRQWSCGACDGDRI
ncbi:hypothetical protein BHY_0520 [Borrelia nietonii YOR]|uniref:Variable outer membrane protein n=1 Tax=Borrelia nietonii YOR TaxID=1293576 RepID=A0ABN4C857_9SPIR|nr:hypothetical protein BHY_0520 [Borrelia nietonii YOR]AHH13980.1 hypothetical protein BHW_0900082 [Borrelia hermsii MTW]